MNEKAQSEEFEDDDDVVDDDATLVGGEDVDVDRLFRDFDKRKRSAPKAGDPAWRRLEKFREEKQTAELVSDFDDYDIDSEDDSGGSSRRTARHRAHG
jgi:hypothetical protein